MKEYFTLKPGTEDLSRSVKIEYSPHHLYFITRVFKSDNKFTFLWDSLINNLYKVRTENIIPAPQHLIIAAKLKGEIYNDEEE